MVSDPQRENLVKVFVINVNLRHTKLTLPDRFVHFETACSVGNRNCQAELELKVTFRVQIVIQKLIPINTR